MDQADPLMVERTADPLMVEGTSVVAAPGMPAMVTGGNAQMDPSAEEGAARRSGAMAASHLIL
jgi:hypothetical protein